MNAEQKNWFSQLTEKRQNSIKVYEEDGIIDIVIGLIVDTYRDSAHFIFELIQNADDAGATKVRFDLDKKGILFAHNGTKKFLVSDPSKERLNGIIPGDINAITTFSLSSKKEDVENKIGKFGIGFKSVFQYTDSPYIYSPPVFFKIENYIIPYEQPAVLDILKANETTAFWLPFNKKDKQSLEAFSEINSKLNDLKNPLAFLKNITSIEITIEGENRVFSKREIRIKDVLIPDTEIKKIKLDSDTILSFEKKVKIIDKDKQAYQLPISIGFILDGKNIATGEKYRHYSKYAWCFFPTKQVTNLNYIINAPFILTPNREAIKEGRTENIQLITALATLTEAAMQGLKEMGYINESFFLTLPIPAKLPSEFRLIGEKLINKIKSGEFIPTKNGKHISVSNAYVCQEPALVELLEYNNCLPLQTLTGKPQARIVFADGKLFSDNNLLQFIYKELSAVPTALNANWLGGQYKSSFIDGMPEEFDILFFKYLAERAPAILAKGQPLWSKKFIPVEDGPEGFDLVTPNSNDGEPQVFIGGSKISGRYVVVDYLANDPDIRKFLITFLNFRIPNEFDDFLHSLKKYESEEPAVDKNEIKADNLEINRLFHDASVTQNEKLLAKLGSKINFLPVIDINGSTFLSNPFTKVIYYPSLELKNYFSKSEEEILWLDTTLLGMDNIDSFKIFIEELTVEVIPYYGNNSLDGLDGYIKNISLSESEYLVKIVHERSCYKKIDQLKTIAWLFDKNGIKKMANQIKVGELHPSYPSIANTIHLELGTFLDSPEKYAGLNEIQKQIMQIIDNFNEELTPEEIKNAIAELIKQKRIKKKKDHNESSKEDVEELDTTTPEGIVDSWTINPIAKNTLKNLEEISSGVIIPSIPNSIDFWINEEETEDDNPGGYLSQTVVGTKYKNEKEEKKRTEMEREIERESKRNKLIELAGQFEPYSFGWFKTLLELEDNFTTEYRLTRNPVKVIFNKAEFDSSGLLVLSDTNNISAIIEEIGELSIQLFFGDEKMTIKGEAISPKKQSLLIKLSNPDQLNLVDLENVSHVVVEASTPDFILERLKTAFGRLDFQNTDNLKNADNFPKDLNFVFGPPGTGKTTYLSWLIGGKNPNPLMFADIKIVPLMEQTNKKVLVLTPTNKAADVLAQRILKNHERENDYPQWLIRFGQSEVLENEPIFVGNRQMKSWVYDQCTLVTTIARFPYDFFKIEQNGKDDNCTIRDFNWDVIIFDEASMIHQSALLYVIYYARQINSKVQFYIGGDPFQIPPIIQFEYPYWSYIPEPAFDNEGKPIFDISGEQMNWKQDGGNIYSFIELMKDDSFINPKTKPHQFTIHNLKKQFRSIVPIGALFSHYRYSGKLLHHRTEDSIAVNANLAVKEIEIPGLPLKALTVIKFPVKKYGGVYKVRTIKGSPYQIYSCLFSIELVKYIQANAKIKTGDVYRVGIISPYAIQSSIISKLLNTIGPGKIEVTAGTVHSFQGDECNLIMVVLNPPKNITRSVRTFLNKKNILNVAISRAKDKMIILTPYDPDGEINTDDLHQIRWIVKLAGTKSECKQDVIGFESSEIENALWGNERYIEEITFQATHQNVNIYTAPARRYEVRHDENAIDFQLSND